MGDKTTGDLGDASLYSGVQGRSLGMGSGRQSPPEAEEFLKVVKANFTHFW